jgi:8-oxo-dGTP pyrophosphatase MutT (NUDIX family)
VVPVAGSSDPATVLSGGSSDPATVLSGGSSDPATVLSGWRWTRETYRGGMSRSIPPQVVPRPATWRPGDVAPWAGLRPGERHGIDLAVVRSALAAHGQAGAVPERMESFPLPDHPPLAGGSLQPSRGVDSAVLVVLFEEADEARLVFTRRSSSLRSHRGQVSFPGGRLDPGEDPPGAALREAFEEVALDPALVTVEGWTHPVMTVTMGSVIMPIVASVPARPHLVASPAEVDRVFDVSLRDLADPGAFHEERWTITGETTAFPLDDYRVWFFEVEGELIWGATARILYELLSVVLAPAG